TSKKLDGVVKDSIEQKIELKALNSTVCGLGERLEEHLRDDRPVSEWLSGKVMAGLLVVGGMVGAAFINQYIVPLFIR
ncbi:MAG: hypothetical protein LBQ90_07380, partial [Synergistaceae bacterium]|nr:hypothetical protein [Synergistaceae bacterium]